MTRKQQREICGKVCGAKNKECLVSPLDKSDRCSDFWREAYRREHSIVRELESQVADNLLRYKAILRKWLDSERREAALADGLAERGIQRRSGANWGHKDCNYDDLEATLNCAGWKHVEGKLGRT